MTLLPWTIGVVVGVTILYYFTGETTNMARKTSARGIRNNNPGNIKSNPRNTWQGKTGSDGVFDIFDTPENGIRAMVKILATYRARGITSIRDIIDEWAPPQDKNNTEAYINAVASRMNATRSTRIDPANMIDFISAIIKHENGSQPYSLGVIRAGVNKS